ncbi:MAG: MFS transporter [Acidobacteria bacterium]|nr:MFS transporter [Acidobacteriota bacterium]
MTSNEHTSAAASLAEITPAITNRRRWSIVGLLFTASMINYMDRATLSMALPVISDDLGLDPTAKGVLTSAFFWSYALMQIPIGWAADRFNLKWLYAAMFTIWSVACGLAGFAGSLGTLIMLRIILGFGESIYLPGGMRIVSRLFPPKERGFPSGMFDFGTRTGLVLDGILLPWIIVTYGWRSMFFIVGFTALVWLVPWLAIFPSKPHRGPEVPPETAEPGAVPSGLARVLTMNRNLLGICLGFFCFDYFWYVILTWLPDYLIKGRGLSIQEGGFYAAITFFIFGVTEPLGGWLADRLIRRGWNETRTRKGIVSVAFSMGLLMIPAGLVASVPMAIGLIFGAGFVGMATGNLLAILQCCAPLAQVGIWTGVKNFSGNLGGIVAPIIMGVLISRTDSYAPGFAVGAILLVIGLIPYWFVVGELKPGGHPSS